MTPSMASGELCITETTHKLPELGPHQVLVEVVASSFNPVDYKVASSAGALVPLLNTTGCDVSGRIINVGPEVAEFNIGDDIIGCSGGVGEHYGSATQYLITDSRYLVTAPKQLSPRTAAAIPLIGITAMDMIHRSQLQSDETLLVIGALGGVGQLLTQIIIARQLSKKLILACGVNNLDKLKKRVAEQFNNINLDIEVVDYDHLSLGCVTVDCVFDTIGNEQFNNALKAIRPLGRMVTINARNTHDLSEAHGKGASIDVVFMLIPWLHSNSQDEILASKAQDLTVKYRGYLQQLVELIDAGKLTINDVEEKPMRHLEEIFSQYADGNLGFKPVFYW